MPGPLFRNPYCLQCLATAMSFCCSHSACADVFVASVTGTLQVNVPTLEVLDIKSGKLIPAKVGEIYSSRAVILDTKASKTYSCTAYVGFHRSDVRFANGLSDYNPKDINNKTSFGIDCSEVHYEGERVKLAGHEKPALESVPRVASRYSWAQNEAVGFWVASEMEVGFCVVSLPLKPKDSIQTCAFANVSNPAQ